MADAAQLVVVVLEDVGVDGADPDAVRFGVAGQRLVILDLVPRDVHGHAGRDAGEPVNLRRVFGFLPWRAGNSRLREYLESRSGVPERPGGQLDLVLLQRCLDGGPVTHSRSLLRSSFLVVFPYHEVLALI